jgi:predicted negative regulator of RcsB-dependent stress response
VLTAKKKLSSREPARKSRKAMLLYDTQEWLKENTKIVGGVVIGLVALIVLWYFYSSGQTADDIEANRQLRLVMQLYQQEQYQLAITGDVNQGIPGLERIVREFDHTPTGQTAMIYLANAYLYTDEVDKAFEAFDNASPKSDILRAAAIAGKAAVHEAKEEFAKAAPLYERAAKMFDSDLIASSRHLAAGRAYGLAGDKKKAKEMLDRVKNAKSTRYHQDADRMLAQFELLEE